MKNKIRVIAAILILVLIPVSVSAASLWTGNNYYNSSTGQVWGINADRITKVTNPGRAYSLKDMGSYSAHITNGSEYVGKSIENAMYWFNKSRIGYIKLFKVTGGQNVSFLFDKSIYIYCAEFDSNFILIDEGKWGTNGTRYSLNKNTAWIMVVFRQVNGDLSDGSGTDTEISSESITGGKYQYILFEPFKYTLNLNGGQYMGSTAAITLNRLGVEQITLPTPTRSGYTFGGWKSDSGNIYSGTLNTEYREDLFKDTGLTAVWNEITPTGVNLDKDYIILEQNGNDTAKISATVTPDSTLNKTIKFSSANESIAKVDSNGNVTAVKSGETKITATAANGVSKSCTVYVMGFDISVPSYCTLNEAYEININIYNNGSAGMSGRKRVILETDEQVELVRVGDSKTSYNVFCETSESYNSNFTEGVGRIASTEDTKKIYYRLRAKEDIKKAGDYEGNVTFTVSVL